MLLEALGIISIQIPAQLPPKQFYKDNSAIVQFVDKKELLELCGKMVNKKGDYRGCATIGGPTMVLPNPCNYPHEHYARIVCHELGHINGWPANHPNPEVYKPLQISEQKDQGK